jgi:hypothetical protein
MNSNIGTILVRIFQQKVENDPNEQLGFNLAYLDSTKSNQETLPPAIGPSDSKIQEIKFFIKFFL